MNDFAIYAIDGVVAVSLLLLGVTSLLRQGYKRPVNMFFFLFAFIADIWIVSFDYSNQLQFGPEALLVINAIANSAALGCLIILLMFVTKIVDFKIFNKIMKWSSLPLWIVCALSATPLISNNVLPSDNQVGYTVNYGPLIWLYVLSMIYIITEIVIIVIYGLRHSRGIKNQQINVIGLGILLSIPMTIALDLIIPLITNSDASANYGNIPLLLLAGYMYYGAFRYKLLDIRSAIVHTLTYILSMSSLIVIYYIAIATISAFFLDRDSVINQSPISIILFLILLFIFQPINNFFEKLTSRVFFRGHYISDELFSRLNHIYAEHTANLNELLNYAANEIATTLKSEQSILTVIKPTNRYLVGGTANHTPVVQDHLLKLLKYTTNNPAIIIVSSLEDDSPVRDLMNQCKIEIIVPLFQTRIIGFLCLGEHLSSRYTARDIKVLDTIAGGLVIAIKNALSIQEIKDVNAASMQQKIDSATKELAANNAMLIKIDEEKDDFVSVTSHELRTPMTIINGYANLLESQQIGSLNDQQLDIISKIGNNAKALIGITNDMLDLSKMEANKTILHLTNASLKVLIKEAISSNQILYDDKSISLSYEGSDVQIKTDTSSFEHIMTNLLANANKFTDKGGSVKITSTVDNTTHLATICVADTGIGISPESIGSLFKKFSQVDNYLKRQYGGTGLGLAICKQMVERLGGTIWVTSTPGVGSQFYFTMPIVENNADNTIL